MVEMQAVVIVLLGVADSGVELVPNSGFLERATGIQEAICQFLPEVLMAALLEVLVVPVLVAGLPVLATVLLKVVAFDLQDQQCPPFD